MDVFARDAAKLGLTIMIKIGKLSFLGKVLDFLSGILTQKSMKKNVMLSHPVEKPKVSRQEKVLRYAPQKGNLFKGSI